MVESWDAGEVQRGFLYSYGYLILRGSRFCMVESSDEGEVRGRFFIIIWSFGWKVKAYLHG